MLWADSGFEIKGGDTISMVERGGGGGVWGHAPPGKF